jgi:hypothetical protein
MPQTRPRATHRREFLKTSTGIVAGAVFAGRPAIAGAEPVAQPPRGDKLRLAIIGCGGRGADNLAEMSTEHIAVLCDVNARNLEKAAGRIRRRGPLSISGACSTMRASSTQ